MISNGFGEEFSRVPSSLPVFSLLRSDDLRDLASLIVLGMCEVWPGGAAFC